MLHFLAQQDVQVQQGGIAVLMGSCFFFLIALAISLVVIAGMWKVFAKAGKPGWAAIVPIYNVIVLLEIVRRPLWWVIFFFIPLANFIVILLVSLDLARKFHQSTAFAIGLWLLAPIFFPLLGFGAAQYDPNA